MLKPFLGLVKKEFIQVFRDRDMVLIIFVVPIVQLLLFGYAVNLEVKNIDLDVYDFDRSQSSREYISTARAGDYFNPRSSELPVLNLEKNFQKSASNMALIIPDDFSEKLVNNDNPTLSLLSDGTDANMTRIGTGYLAQITQRYMLEYYKLNKPIEIKYDILYNPEAKSVDYMVPGIVATLLTMVTIMLTSMAIVREREGGTLEQLLVTPISSLTLLLGKLFPFAILGIVEISLALAVGVLWFGVPFVGSPILLFVLAGIYLLTTLGVGLFFSTVTSTQQQAMFFAWFFSVFSILTSGFFTPISNMPQWMQYITYINPMRYFITITRAIMMKGAGLFDLTFETSVIIIYGILIFLLAASRFSKRIS